MSEIAQHLSIDRAVAACLVNRGIDNVASAEGLLSARLNALTPPDLLVDMPKAVRRIERAVVEYERVGVYGDYDVDGITSAALVDVFLRRLKVDTTVRIADRNAGYGLTEQLIDHFAEQRCSVVIALDCGTSDHLAAERAQALGVDLIIVDHHRIEGPFPPSHAFINPQRPDCGFEDKTLAAVGLAFYFAAAVRSALCQKGYIQRNELDPRQLLDFVALGTIADVVPLRRNNRILVKAGLMRMSTSPRPGIEALIRTARIRSTEIRTDHVAYQIAPRLNAAGRMSAAKEAFDLLITENRSDAEQLAANLDRLSKMRRVVEQQVLQEARQQIREARLGERHVVVVAADGWHKGVLGIVAARLSEAAGRPAFVVGFHDAVGVGSARGQGQLDLYESLAASSDHLERFGGHRDAAGFVVNEASFASFKTAVQHHADRCWRDVSSEEIVCDALLNPSDLTPRLLADMNRFGPFGEGFPEPVFAVDEMYVLNRRVVGQSHLKLDLKVPSGSIAAFGPNMGEHARCEDHVVSVVAKLTVDEWRGGGVPELKLVAPPAKYTTAHRCD